MFKRLAVLRKIVISMTKQKKIELKNLIQIAENYKTGLIFISFMLLVYYWFLTGEFYEKIISILFLSNLILFFKIDSKSNNE